MINIYMKKLTNDDIIARLNKLYNYKYDLSKVDYTGQNGKLTLICPLHGEWSKMAQKIFAYGNSKVSGCPHCNYKNAVKNRSYNKLKTTEQFVEQAKRVHGNIYDYSLINYINTDTKVRIICPSHGPFDQLPWGHLKYGCRQCNIHKSKVEKRWLTSLNNKNIVHQYKIPGTNYVVDGFDPITNTIYEFYGDYWHGNPKKFPPLKINTKTPKNKTFGELYQDTLVREQNLRNMGYTVISMWESDFR